MADAGPDATGDHDHPAPPWWASGPPPGAADDDPVTAHRAARRGGPPAVDGCRDAVTERLATLAQSNPEAVVHLTEAVRHLTLAARAVVDGLTRDSTSTGRERPSDQPPS